MSCRRALDRPTSTSTEYVSQLKQIIHSANDLLIVFSIQPQPQRSYWFIFTVIVRCVKHKEHFATDDDDDDGPIDRNFYPSFSYTNPIHSIIFNISQNGLTHTQWQVETKSRKQFFVLRRKENSWNRSRMSSKLPFNSFMCDLPSSRDENFLFNFATELPFCHSPRRWSWHSLRVCAFNIMTPRHYLKVWISWYASNWRCAPSE